MKNFIFIVIAAILLLTGCEDRSNEEGADSQITNSVAMDESSDEREKIEEEELVSVSEAELQMSPIITGYSEFEEVSQQTYLDPSEYDGYLLTDNDATRVFIFAKDHTQVYKTIFIKKTNRLKIIDLVNNTSLMNEQVNINR